MLSSDGLLVLDGDSSSSSNLHLFGPGSLRAFASTLHMSEPMSAPGVGVLMSAPYPPAYESEKSSASRPHHSCSAPSSLLPEAASFRLLDR